MTTLYNGFLAAIQVKLKKEDELFPLVPETFAMVIVDARADSDFKNLTPDLESIKIYGTPFGLTCPQFGEFMTTAQATGTLDRLNPTYSRAKATMSQERLQSVQKELGDKWPKVTHLADKYLEKVGHE